MKKLLLGSAAIAMGMAFAAPAAQAQGVTLDISGHHKGYVSWSGTDENIDQDGLNDGADMTATDEPDDDARAIDWLRETEIHFTGEATLDNGLTVGAHMETDIDNSNTFTFIDSNGDTTTVSDGDQFDTEEAYVYFSGAWGRMNFGKEDGAAYLLQVAAPSADSNIDGLRQFINPINYMVGSPTWNVNNTATTGLDGSAASGQFGFNTLIAGGEYFDIDNDGSDNGDLYIATSAQFDPSGNVASPLVNNTMAGLVSDLTRFDYDQALAGYDNKISYMTPVFNGFQMGASYTPDVNEGSRGLDGNGQEEVAGGIFGSAWEISARYEGQWDEVGIAFGGGYTHVNLEDDELKDAGNGVVAFISADGTTAPSAGDTLFHLDDREAWNVGLDLDWMAFGLGAAYTEQEAGLGGALEADTWTVGADYTTGPFKFGLNYYSQERDFFDVDEIDTERYSAGVVYTYGPGMTFRGSVNYTDHDTPDFGQLGTAAQAATNRDQDATSVLLGTQINF